MVFAPLRPLLAGFLLCILGLPIAGSVLAATVDELEEQIKEKQKEIAELQKEADSYKQTINQHQDYASSLQAHINNFNAQIGALQSQVNLTNSQIQGAQLQIEQTNIEITEKEDTMERRRTQMTALLATVQQSNEKSFVEVMIENDNLSDFFNQVQARTVIQDELQNNLDELKQLKVQLEEKRAQLEQEKVELGEKRTTLAAQQQILAGERAKQATLLSQTKETQAGYEALLSDVQAKQKAVNDQIFELEEKLRQELNPGSVPTGSFAWPAEGLLTQGYGCVKAWNNAYSSGNCAAGYNFHNGLDVAARLGTPIRATADGTVVAVSNAPYAYGLWVAVQHGNGIVSAYGHMSAQAVSNGQSVKRGDIIGYMGSTGFSTGSHLHFMLYAPGTFRVVASSISGFLPIGATINPFNYLR